MGQDLPVLWQYSFSNFNEKARWALDFKGIPHRRPSVLPISPRSLWFSRGDGTLPVLDLDGRRIVDSTAIIAALQERQPDPPLYPADPAERRRALELEDYFDEDAGHDVRRVGFVEWWTSRRAGPANSASPSRRRCSGVSAISSGPSGRSSGASSTGATASTGSRTSAAGRLCGRRSTGSRRSGTAGRTWSGSTSRSPI